MYNSLIDRKDMHIYIRALLCFNHVMFDVLIIMSLGIKRHKFWCTVQRYALKQMSIIIIIHMDYVLVENTA